MASGRTVGSLAPPIKARSNNVRNSMEASYISVHNQVFFEKGNDVQTQIPLFLPHRNGSISIDDTFFDGCCEISSILAMDANGELPFIKVQRCDKPLRTNPYIY